MRNWRTSTGGAVGVFGTSLMAVALCEHFKDEPILFWTIFAGAVLSAGGRAWTALTAADAKEVEKLTRSFETEHIERDKGIPR